METLDSLHSKFENDYTQFVTASLIFSCFGFLLAGLGPLSAAFHIHFIQHFLPALSEIQPATAVQYMLAALGLFLLTRTRRTRTQIFMAQGIAGFLIFAGFHAVVRYFLHIDRAANSVLSFKQLNLFFPYQEGFPVAINLIIFGAILLFLDTEQQNLRPAQFLAFILALLPLQSLIALSYGVHFFPISRPTFIATQMSHLSCIFWLSLFIAALLSRPDKGLLRPFTFDKELSHTWRLTLAMAIFVPLISGFIFSKGYQNNYYDPAIGFSFLAITCTLMMTLFVWRSANQTWRIRRVQIQAENQIKKALQLRDEFLSIASHELKTPLTSLSLQAQISKFNLLKDDSILLSKEKQMHFLNAMDTQVLRLSHLVEDMLDISRIESGRFTPVFSLTNLEGLIRDVIEQLDPQINEAQCPVTFTPHDSPVGMWDTYRIEQLMINLLTNALKYGSKKPIHIELRQMGPAAVISLKDNGIGIALENQERIFNRFERAVSAKGITGLGLGLYIVKKILESHQGNIRVQSEVGMGSTFTIELPVQPQSGQFFLPLKEMQYEISS